MAVSFKRIMLQHKLILGILSAFIFCQMILSVVFPYITKFIIDDVLLRQNIKNLKWILLTTITIILFQVPINIGVSYYCSKWTQLVIYNLRRDISQRFLSQKDNSNENGLFVNTIINDCELIGNQLLSLLLNSVPNILLVILYIIILFQLNTKLTVITLLIIPLYVIASYITSKRIFIITKELQGYRDKLIEFLNSYIRNKLLIDLYNLKESEQKKFKKVTEQVKDSNIKENTILSVFSSLSGLISVISPILTLFIGSVMVIRTEISLGTLIAFNSYVALLFGPLEKILNIFPVYTQMKASIERVEKANYCQKRIKHGYYSKKQLDENKQINARDLIPYIGNKPLFNLPISFSLSKNEILQIDGPNGVGKSIILKCLINYFVNFSGDIEVQKDINIVYVPQENFLFKGTVLKNIVVGIAKYKEEYLLFLIKLLKFDLSLDKIVNPFNINLSSGQLQKIKLIHAFLCNPDVLLLDEALANIDKETVKKIIQFSRKKNISIVLVYHGEVDSFLENSNYRVLHLNCTDKITDKKQ
ncbi:TPA: ABC transporter ATP-binding protein [Enterococcus faecalis]|nr:ABC transporter ATP-binding protein [Enterococcus faecalis]